MQNTPNKPHKKRESLSDYETGRWFKLLLEKFPDKYPNYEAIGNRFGVSDRYAEYLVQHYDTVEQLVQTVSPNIRTRVRMLPEFMVREVRRAPVEIQPQIVEAIIARAKP